MEQHEIKIYQLKRDEAMVPLWFTSYADLIKRELSVDSNNYELIYTCTRPTPYTLDDVYREFNINHPADFTGHSLSVGDVVVRTEDGTPYAYYVDDFGFKEVPEFLEVSAE